MVRHSWYVCSACRSENHAYPQDKTTFKLGWTLSVNTSLQHMQTLIYALSLRHYNFNFIMFLSISVEQSEGFRCGSHKYILGHNHLHKHTRMRTRSPNREYLIDNLPAMYWLLCCFVWLNWDAHRSWFEQGCLCVGLNLH